MKLFGKKKEEKQDGANWIVKMALEEAMRELKIEKTKNDVLEKELKLLRDNQFDIVKTSQNTRINLENNLEVLKTTIENIRTMCKNKNGKVINSKEILKELGE